MKWIIVLHTISREKQKLNSLVWRAIVLGRIWARLKATVRNLVWESKYLKKWKTFADWKERSTPRLQPLGYSIPTHPPWDSWRSDGPPLKLHEYEIFGLTFLHWKNNPEHPKNEIMWSDELKWLWGWMCTMKHNWKTVGDTLSLCKNYQ
jgi:hypothetical protein